MYLFVFASFLLTYLPIALAIQVGIGVASDHIMQVCSVRNAQDVCCVALDLDVQDDRGYGWFKPDSVAFEGLTSPHTFTAVYGLYQRPPCAGEIQAHRYGNQDWQTSLLPFSKAGSALIQTSWRYKMAPEKYPDTIISGTKRYTFMGKAPSGTYWYRNVESTDHPDIIYGRVFDDIRSLANKNTTLLQRGKPGDHMVA